MATVEEIRFPADGGRPTRALLVRPDVQGGPWPGLLVLHEVLVAAPAAVKHQAERKRRPRAVVARWQDHCILHRLRSQIRLESVKLRLGCHLTSSSGYLIGNADCEVAMLQRSHFILYFRDQANSSLAT